MIKKISIGIMLSSEYCLKRFHSVHIWMEKAKGERMRMKMTKENEISWDNPFKFALSCYKRKPNSKPCHQFARMKSYRQKKIFRNNYFQKIMFYMTYMMLPAAYADNICLKMLFYLLLIFYFHFYDSNEIFYFTNNSFRNLRIFND